MQLGRHQDLEVIYFGRFGLSEDKKGFGELEQLHNFVYVPCEGGVWNRETVIRAIDKFELDVIFTEDDWYSASGIARACAFWKKPFFFHTPLDSIPVRFEGLYLMGNCKKVFVPTEGAKRYLEGNNIKTIKLSHGVDSKTFRPLEIPDKPDGFTFIWVGRDDNRKNLGSTILAYEKLVKDGYKTNLLVRTDWSTPLAQRTLRYITQKRLPIIKEQMVNCPHEQLVYTYNRGDCYVCSSKAGGFELGIIEANACGLPVLCTNHTFMNEQVVHNKNGLLVPVSSVTVSKYHSLWGRINIDRLAEAMKYYVNNPEIASGHGNYGRAYVRHNFRWDKVGEILYNETKDSLQK